MKLRTMLTATLGVASYAIYRTSPLQRLDEN